MPFDLDGARKAGATDTQIADHLASTLGFDISGARKSGAADSDIATFLSRNERPSTSPNINTLPSVEGAYDVNVSGAIPRDQSISLMESVGAGAANVLPSAVRNIKGAASLFTPSGVEAISKVTRGGLGISPEEAPSWEVFKQGIKDSFGSWEGFKHSLANDPVGTAGVVYGAGGLVKGATVGLVDRAGLLESIANSSDAAAKRIYASSVKMPLSKKWTKVRSPEGQTMVEQAVETGLREKVPPSELGLEMTRKGKEAAGQEIGKAAAQIPGTINIGYIVTNGLSRARTLAKKGDRPAKDIAAIDQFAEDFKAGRTAELTPAELQDIKTRMYDLVSYDKTSGKSDALIEMMRKGIAHAARVKLEEMNPSMRVLNQNFSDWNALEQAMERAVPRLNNRDLIDLSTKVLIGRESLPLAIFNQTIGHPAIKSRIAFMLSKKRAIPSSSLFPVVPENPKKSRNNFSVRGGE